MSRAAVAAPDRWRLWRLGAARTAAIGAWHAPRVGLIALVVLAPLPFASQWPPVQSMLALVVALLLLLWALAAALERDRISKLTPRLWPLVVLFALAPLWALVQAGSWTPRSWHSPLWQLARFAVPDAIGRITIAPHATGSAAMRLLTYGGLFWLAFQYGRSVSFARTLVKALAASGLGYAAYGLVVYASGLDVVLWLPRPCCRGDLTSTFINPNHYAPYAGLGLLAALGLILTTLPKGAPAPGGFRARLVAAVLRSWWRVLAVALLAVAVMLTHSRGGLIATALGVVTLMLTLGAVGVVSRRTLKACALLVALGAALTVYLVGERTIARFDDLLGALEVPSDAAALDAGGLRPGPLRRFDVYDRVMAALADAPVTGTGFGTFPDAFRWYQGPVNGFFDYAHDTYLEAALELGIPVALGLIGAVGGAAGIAARGLRRRRRDRLYPALAVASAVLLGSHALIDFSVQIPAIAATFAALLGLGCAQSFGQARPASGALPRHRPGPLMAEASPPERRPRRRRARRRRGRARRQDLGAVLVAALAAFGLANLALPRTVASILLWPAADTLDRLRRLPVDSQALDRVIAAQAAASAWIDSGELWADVAVAHLARLRAAPVDDPRTMVTILLQAESALQRALERRPGNAIAWWQLARVTSTLRRPDDQVAAALRLSVVTGNRVKSLLFPRLQLALAKWPRLDQATRGAFLPQLALAMAQDPQQFVTLVRRSLAQEEVRVAFRNQPALLAQYEARLE